MVAVWTCNTPVCFNPPPRRGGGLASASRVKHEERSSDSTNFLCLQSFVGPNIILDKPCADFIVAGVRLKVRNRPK